jgi:hypothetical protein
MEEKQFVRLSRLGASKSYTQNPAPLLMSLKLIKALSVFLIARRTEAAYTTLIIIKTNPMSKVFTGKLKVTWRIKETQGFAILFI